MNEPSNYTAHISPKLDRERLDAQWVQIAAQLPGPRREKASRPMVQLGLAVGTVCVLLGFFWWSTDPLAPTPSVWAGALVTSDDAPVNFTLTEGTLIELDPRSEVELLRSNARSVQVSLHAGSARFDVAKRRTRRFSVHAGEVEILVTGTQFRVKRSPSLGGERIRVDVDEGSVEVQRSGSPPVRLSVGENWSTFVRQSEAVSETPARSNDDLSQEQSQAPAKDATQSPSSASNEDIEAERRAAQREKRRAQAEDARRETDEASTLFERGNAARRLGRVREAADLYAALVSEYARDQKAPLAAFELGRIRMDSLGDMQGAIAALERALQLDARRAFAEDALARIVLAQESLGDKRACESARGRYLSRYPDGIHASHVATRCLSR